MQRYFRYGIMTPMASLALVVCALSACAPQRENVAADIVFSGDTASIAATSPICAKIKVMKVKEEPHADTFTTVATAYAEPGNYAEICSPFDGRVTCASVRLGDKVKVGQCLYGVSSGEFIDMEKTYFQALGNFNVQTANLSRKQTLFEHGIVAQRELDEARQEYEVARQEKESAENALKIYKVSPENLTLGQPLQVKSPINGEVVSYRITPGQLLKADAEPQLIIANLDKVWVTALIKERYIGSIDTNGEAEVYTESDPKHPIKGRIMNVGNLVDEATRCVQVMLSCDNADRKLKHGMFVSVHFKAAPRPSIVLPATAIFQGEQSSYVYVAATKPNTYVRRQVEVTTNGDDSGKVCIQSGLHVGEMVVADGGLFLNE